MAAIAVIMFGAGLYLMWTAWESHKSQTPVTPLQSAITALQSGSGTATQGAPSPAAVAPSTAGGGQAPNVTGPLPSG